MEKKPATPTALKRAVQPSNAHAVLMLEKGKRKTKPLNQRPEEGCPTQHRTRSVEQSR